MCLYEGSYKTVHMHIPVPVFAGRPIVTFAHSQLALIRNKLAYER